jgi:hypothetical protein
LSRWGTAGPSGSHPDGRGAGWPRFPRLAVHSGLTRWERSW